MEQTQFLPCKEKQEATSNKCIASSNKCLTSSNKKLVETLRKAQLKRNQARATMNHDIPSFRTVHCSVSGLCLLRIVSWPFALLNLKFSVQPCMSDVGTGDILFQGLTVDSGCFFVFTLCSPLCTAQAEAMLQEERSWLVGATISGSNPPSPNQNLGFYSGFSTAQRPTAACDEGNFAAMMFKPRQRERERGERPCWLDWLLEELEGQC